MITAKLSKMEKEMKTTDRTSNSKTRMIGKLIAAVIAPNDTKPEEMKTIINNPKQIPAVSGCKAITTPNEVATPFPPLKCAKIGKT